MPEVINLTQHSVFLLQRFPLGGDDEVMSSTLQQFAKVIDEVSPGSGTDGTAVQSVS